MQENKKHRSFTAIATFLYDDDSYFVDQRWSFVFMIIFFLNTESREFLKFLYQWLWLKLADYLVHDSVKASVTKKTYKV